MRIKAYLQISKNGKITISRKSKNTPMHNNYYGRYRKYYPTVQFIINLEVSDECFKDAEYQLNLAL